MPDLAFKGQSLLHIVDDVGTLDKVPLVGSSGSHDKRAIGFAQAIVGLMGWDLSWGIGSGGSGREVLDGMCKMQSEDEISVAKRPVVMNGMDNRKREKRTVGGGTYSSKAHQSTQLWCSMRILDTCAQSAPVYALVSSSTQGRNIMKEQTQDIGKRATTPDLKMGCSWTAPPRSEIELAIEEPLLREEHVDKIGMVHPPRSRE
ncbi:hypothetical protein BDN72DRAFT_865833 [Pluteus cervinus]|uniref:Uncharacterized protein n=1 Tax=Pluteus cervinus TaxID=181527 RepID=A0ACD3A102_9AGAR|nr:hypothetical protein BDN72DRAFT_865833 [Pluteus cervinus]